MKIRCEVRDKAEASVFCSADEAAFCNGCDLRIHHANNLAGKHIRSSFQFPFVKEYPRCDIGQEKRAILFCQEDSAILCGECDIPIHGKNEHTQKHDRCLLTFIQLSDSSSSSSRGPASDLASTYDDSDEIKSSVSDQSSNPSNSTEDNSMTMLSQENSMLTSTISKYLMEISLSGWHVDDFLDPPCSSHGFRKVSL